MKTTVVAIQQPSNNPPAFAQPMAATNEGDMYVAIEKHPDFGGMTLRDYFAAKALQAIVAWPDGPSRKKDAQGLPIETYEQSCARVAYEYADAMLAERNKS